MNKRKPHVFTTEIMENTDFLLYVKKNFFFLGGGKYWFFLFQEYLFFVSGILILIGEGWQLCYHVSQARIFQDKWQIFALWIQKFTCRQKTGKYILMYILCILRI